MSKVLPTVALLFVALVSADDVDFFFSAHHQQRFFLQANASCSVCSNGVTDPSVTGHSCSKNNAGTVASGSTFNGTCNGTSFTSTCTNGVMSSPTPTISALKMNGGGGNSAYHFVCTAGVTTGVAIDDTCRTNCDTAADECNSALGNGSASCANCTTTTRQRRAIRQTIVVGGKLLLICPCTGLVGNALTACCTNCFVVGCSALGAPLTLCACEGAIVTCPGCSSNKDSNKLLLLLLLLLLLIPLLLCCLLLCCCLLRRKKKEQDTHFATFDPQAASAVIAPMLGPTACVAPCVPTASFSPCATTFGGPLSCAPTFGAPILGSSCAPVL